MLPVDELRTRLKALPLRALREAEAATGVKYRTIRNIRDGWVKDPRVNTAMPLSDWLERRAASE